MPDMNDWKRLGTAVKARRERLGLRQEDVAASGGPSTAVQRQIEGGKREGGYRASILSSLEHALGWRRGEVLRGILEGRPPAGWNSTYDSWVAMAHDSSDYDLTWTATTGVLDLSRQTPGLGDGPDLTGATDDELLGEVLRRLRSPSTRSVRLLPAEQPATSQDEQQPETEDQAYARWQRGEGGFDDVTARRMKIRESLEYHPAAQGQDAAEEEPVAARTAYSEDIAEHTRALERDEESQDPGGDEPS